MSRAVPLFVALAVLAGCAQSAPVRVNEVGVADDTPAAQRLAELQKSAYLLRQQHQAMGETIAWMDGEIRGLQANPSSIPEPVSVAPAPKAEALPVAKAAEPMVLKPTPAPAAPIHKPAPVAAVAKPAVAPLNADDMDIEPEKASEKSQAVENEGNKRFYLVHLASYLETAQVAAGWREFSAKVPVLLNDKKPMVTTFTDTRGRKWQRLNIGAFETQSAARERCNALKAIGTWCDVLENTAAGVKPL